MEQGEEVEDIFDSALESLFGQHQAATGNAGELSSLSLDWTPGTAPPSLRSISFSLLDPPVAGLIRFRIPPNAVNKLQAHYQWDAGTFVARLIHSSSGAHDESSTISRGESLSTVHTEDLGRVEANVRGVSVFELGAGTGLPGIVSARHGASPVVISDYPDPALLQCIRENAALSWVGHHASRAGSLSSNDGSKRGTNVDVRGLNWTDTQAVANITRDYPDRFDRVICADTLWLSSLHIPLLDTIDAVLADTSTARAIVVSGFHTGRRALVRFFASAAARRLVADPVADVFEYNVVTQQARTWTGLMPFPTSPLAKKGSPNGESTAYNDNTNGQQRPQDAFDNMDDLSERTRWLLYVSLRRAKR